MSTEKCNSLENVSESSAGMSTISVDIIGSDSSNYETNKNEFTRKVLINENVSTIIVELTECCPQVWNPTIFIKNYSFLSRIHFYGGNIDLVDLLINSCAEQSTLRITKRMKLIDTKLYYVSRLFNLKGNSGHLILTANGFQQNNQKTNQLSEDGTVLQLRPLEDLVTYLKHKDSAGVIVNKDDNEKDNNFMLFLFPPSDYALELLLRVAPNLRGETKGDYLVGVVIRATN